MLLKCPESFIDNDITNLILKHQLDSFQPWNTVLVMFEDFVNYQFTNLQIHNATLFVLFGLTY